MHEFNLVVY